MYCSSCGVAVAQGLSYCNYCGAKLNGVKGDDVVKSPEIRPEKLVEMMGAVFVCGLGFIAVLIGVLKAVAGFDVPLLSAVLIFSFLMMLLIEGVLISLLLKGRRGAKEAVHTARLKDQTTKELGEAQARLLSEPLPSVTEHTTRAFAPIHHERESK
jgi:hypothetical protein